jgi:hypothetical protein
LPTAEPWSRNSRCRFLAPRQRSPTQPPSPILGHADVLTSFAGAYQIAPAVESAGRPPRAFALAAESSGISGSYSSNELTARAARQPMVRFGHIGLDQPGSCLSTKRGAGKFNIGSDRAAGRRAPMPACRLRNAGRWCARRAGASRRRRPETRALAAIYGADLRLVTQSEIGRIWLTEA